MHTHIIITLFISIRFSHTAAALRGCLRSMFEKEVCCLELEDEEWWCQQWRGTCPSLTPKHMCCLNWDPDSWMASACEPYPPVQPNGDSIDPASLLPLSPFSFLKPKLKAAPLSLPPPKGYQQEQPKPNPGSCRAQRSVKKRADFHENVLNDVTDEKANEEIKMVMDESDANAGSEGGKRCRLSPP